MFVGYESGDGLDQIMDDPSRRYHLRSPMIAPAMTSFRTERQTREGLEILPARLTNPLIFTRPSDNISLEVWSYSPFAIHNCHLT